ncbi:MAG: ATP/GTP-binding protein [Sulfolobaceae archaeon]
MYFIYVIGTAGSGKTSLAKSLQEYLYDQELSAEIINLDPAVETLPYRPAFDIREYVDAYEVMNKYGLGPNSSLVVSIDLALAKAVEIKEEISKIEANYIIVDTPGQIELFAYRDSGRLLSSLISGNNKSITLFLIDSFLAKEPMSFVSLLLLSSSVKFRFLLPQLNVISKSDLLTDKEKERIEKWSYGEEIIDYLSKYDEYSYELYTTLIESLEFEPIFVSSVTLEGFNELFAELQRVLAGGEDYYTEEPNPKL